MRLGRISRRAVDGLPGLRSKNSVQPSRHRPDFGHRAGELFKQLGGALFNPYQADHRCLHQTIELLSLPALAHQDRHGSVRPTAPDEPS